MADIEAIKANGGIYRIVNRINGRAYVGQALDFKERNYEHFKRLRKGSHHTRHLQRAYNKYGAESFVFEILERCAPDRLTEREQHWMNVYGRSALYNSAPAAGSTRGYKYTKEQIARLRAGQLAAGKCFTPEGREAIAKASRARTWTTEMRARLSASLSGRKASAETRALLSRMRRGKPVSAGSRKALLDFARTKRSQETRARMSATWRRIWAERRAVND